MANWRELLEVALPALDEVYGADVDPSAPNWTIGGGAAISLTLEYRETQDVDIFIQHGRLKSLVPNNNQAARRISDTYQWPGHYLKFERPDGEIDFLSAALQTDTGYTIESLAARQVAVETPEEVIVKKMRFRGANFTARDVFDLAAVAKARPDLPVVLAAEVPDMIARVQEEVRIHASRGVEELRQSLALTKAGEELLPDVFKIANVALLKAATLAEKDPIDRGALENIAKGPADAASADFHQMPEKDRGR